MQTFPWGKLLDWYKENGRHHLPWRNYEIVDENTLLYRVWLSEIFLQQTQVSRVIDYFERVIKAFPSVKSLADTEYEEFFPYYQGLGYYSRARNILKTAKIIQSEHQGIFPKEKNILSKLPGVGPYTTNALLAFGCGESYLAWDTNLEKSFSRYYTGRKDIKLTPEEKDIIENDFRKFIEYTTRKVQKKDIIRAINNALMDFAALVDLKNPEQIDWENYPIQSGEFYKTHGSLEPNEVKKTVSFPIPDSTVIVVLHRDHKIYYGSRHSAARRIHDSHPSSLDPSVSPHDDGAMYAPFILPPPLHRDTRNYVQEYFRSNYNLELSVRPIQKKWLNKDGEPYVLVNAQIQTGKHNFGEFSKKEYQSSFKSIE